MKFIDIPQQDRFVAGEIKKAVAGVVDRGDFILGDNVQKFEEEMAEYHGVKHAIGVGSGTAALHLAVQALNLPQGSEVITTPFTYYATTEAILKNGLVPVFADINLEDGNIDPGSAERMLTEKTRAILPVHIFGKPCKMMELVDLSRKKALYIIEDCAQAIGADISGKKVGSIGNMGCLSFYPTKNLGCYGDGGMITTDSDELVQYIKKLRENGVIGPYEHQLVGENSRLDTMQASILNIKAKYLDKLNKIRQKHAEIYMEELSSLQQKGVIQLPTVNENETHVFHQFTLRVKNRNALKQFLDQHGIPSAIYYSRSLADQPVFRDHKCRADDLKNTHKLCSEVLSLPIAPHLEESDIRHVCDIIKKFYG